MEIDFLSVLFRWMHILPAIIAVGATVFMRVALVPALGELPDAERQRFHEAIRARWSKWVMGCITFLLISGFYNFFTLNAKYQFPKLYHPLFGIKVLLALAIFAIASILAGRSSTAQRVRKNPKPLLNLNIALAVLLVCISGVMRNITMNSPLKASTTPAAAAAPEQP
ncbi:MAG TPA: hypothetical protein VHD36_17825 [Pirellulales bacterium]|nr:hypothetical protein [Pirellulales bacterium]